MIRPPKHWTAWILSWSIALTGAAFSSTATAQKNGAPKKARATTTTAADVEVDPPPAPAPAPPPAPPPPPPVTQPEPPPPEPKPASAGPLLGFVERLPLSAYPEDHVRGIYGGSLWSTFHGMQWPFYPKTGIGVSGYVWIDSGYEHIARGNPKEQGTKYWLQQGRLVLRLTPTWSDGEYFVQGQAELVANQDQSQTQPIQGDVDDVWVRAGRWKSWDVQLGRYEGWEIYHLGMGMDLHTQERYGAIDTAGYGAPSIYGVTYAFYRPQSVGEGAVHIYGTDYLRFELGTQFGNEGGKNILAGRPVGVLDFGWLKIKGGGEYRKLTDQADGAKGDTSQRGFGAAIQAIVDPYFELGGNFGYAMVDVVKSDGSVDAFNSVTTYSLGGFANARIVPGLLAGVGYDNTYLEDIHYSNVLRRHGKFRQQQMFVALQYLVLGQLFVKAVVGYADADFAPSDGTAAFANQMVSGRIRLQYLF